MPGRSEQPSASSRMQSTGTMVFGVTYLGIFLLAPSDLSQYASLTADWWAWLSGAVVVASALAFFVGGLSRRVELLAPVAYVCAAAYLLVAVAWFIGWTGQSGADSSASAFDFGLVFLPQVGSCVLVLCDRIAAAVVNLLVAGGLSLFAAAIVSGGADWTDFVSAFWALSLASIYLVICWAVMSGARRFDERRRAAGAQTAELLQSRVRDAERRRLDAMVHDRLIALLMALRPGPLSEGFRWAMGSVLDEIANWSTDTGTGRDQVAATEFVQRLRVSVDELGSGLDIETIVTAPRDAEYPAAAADAIVDAVGEAVRNFHRHAGPGAAGAIRCGVEPDRLSAVVVDDGVGFDPAAVPAHRIGVALGILERMRQLEGGSSRVVSEPGHGTRVELMWVQSGVRP
ncbi:sensor histidine kinase [Gordonia neofelifaecis]|nr:ATP-binding protein [Gordonia neofelifaecis]